MALTKLRLLLLSYPEHQYVIAAKARISPARLSEYANGKRRIPPNNLARLCFVLGVEPEDVTGYVDPEDHLVV